MVKTILHFKRHTKRDNYDADIILKPTDVKCILTLNKWEKKPNCDNGLHLTFVK